MIEDLVMTMFIVMIVIVVLLFNVENVNYLVVLIFYTHINVIFADYINVKVVFILNEEMVLHMMFYVENVVQKQV
jgi:hypothetical protein